MHYFMHYGFMRGGSVKTVGILETNTIRQWHISRTKAASQLPLRGNSKFASSLQFVPVAT